MLLHQNTVRVNSEGGEGFLLHDFKVKLPIDQRKPAATGVGYNEEEEE